MQPEELFAMVFIIGMFAGVFVIFLAMRQRAELLQMQHRERMAMIERGQIPLADSAHAYGASRRAGTTTTQTARSLSLGIIVVGFGVALMTIVSIAGGSPEAGIGVGGSVAILGAAFIVRSLVVRSEIAAPPASPASTQLQHSSPPPPPPASDDRI